MTAGVKLNNLETMNLSLFIRSVMGMAVQVVFGSRLFWADYIRFLSTFRWKIGYMPIKKLIIMLYKPVL